MKARQWFLATAALAVTLSNGAFADSPRWDRGPDRDDYAYAQQYQYRNEYRKRYRDCDATATRFAMTATTAITIVTTEEATATKVGSVYDCAPKSH